MKELSKLIEALDGIRVNVCGTGNLLIESITNDSRSVKANSLFVCIAGFNTDGHKFIAEAIQKGATAIVVEKDVDFKGVTLIRVTDSRRALAKLSSKFYDNPDLKLRLLGVTGTNGKTTTSYLINSILQKDKRKTGLLGTINYQIGDDLKEAGRTTPESLELESFFKKALDNGVTDIVIEVSSHSLDLHRVEEIEFDQAIFTSFSLDHLDYHKTIDKYLEAKIKLFTQLDRLKKKGEKVAIVNIDDPNSKKILSATAAKKITYGLSQEAQVYAHPKSMDIDGISFDAYTPKGRENINLKLTGNFNIYNALAAISSAIALEIPLETIKKGLEEVSNIPGRFEKIKGKKFNLIVDYAHTPEALKNLLITAKEIVKGRLIVVFGCGGDRDRSKRPMMGELSATYADFCILTSDNPRGEDPFRILLDTEAGMQKIKAKGEYLVLVDRRQAIEEACRYAKEGDLVVIAGKGHETYQILSDRTIHFDDREVAREVIGRLDK